MLKRIRMRARREWVQSFGMIAATTALVGSASSTSRAVVVSDAVMDWNQIALAATVTAGQGAIPQVRSMTIVQVAVNDAVNGITGEHGTYLSHGTAPAGASPEAATITAAHSALVTVFAANDSLVSSLNTARSASLAAQGLTEADPGVEWGERVAAAILSARSTDGAAQAQVPFTAPGGGTPGVWVAIGTAAPQLAGWGRVTPWVVESSLQFRPEGPPSLDSGRYARDYNEVQQLGAMNNSGRTPEQTDIARFWLASPSSIWNHVARQVIDARGLNLSDTAHVFALMYLASADASITCWDAKYAFSFWRPQAAIRNGHLDGNDATVGDPGWLPLFPTPPHPEYFSAHAANSSAMATMLGFLFGDNPGMPIEAISSTNSGFTREWTTFSQGVDEVIDARVYSGIHYRTSDEVGARVGRQIARFVVNHVLR